MSCDYVHVTLKLATSLDSRIALADGTSQWITGPQSRRRVHEMRADHDAVLAGIGTVLADDPLLTVRTEPAPSVQPVRIIADSQARTPTDSRLIRSISQGRVVLATDRKAEGAQYEVGAELWPCGRLSNGGIDLHRLIAHCAEQGLTRLFLEGGGKLAASFMKAGLIDRIYWFRAPFFIGGDGLPSLGPLALENLSDAALWSLSEREQIGQDSLEVYTRLNPQP